MKLDPIVVPPGLSLRILKRIALARRRAARVRFAGLACGAFISSIALAAAVLYLVQEFYVSGFYDYATLLFSDSAALSHWQEIVFSLVEALPSVTLLALFGVGSIFVLTLIRSIRTARIAFASPLSYGSI